MCKRTGFEAKTAEFDVRLLEFFQEWRSFVQQQRSEEDLKHTNWLEDFCSYVWDSLVRFEKLGRLEEPLRPRSNSLWIGRSLKHLEYVKQNQTMTKAGFCQR